MARSRGNRERSEQSLFRRGVSRTPRRSILIVCEGEKTEPLYFKAMKADRDMSLTTVHVEVCGEECGSAPISVVEFAFQRFEERAREAKTSPFKLPFEQVYCVMDKDRHPSLDDALNLVERSKKKVPIQGIVSCPCFEIWYLLHFTYSTKPYGNFAELKPDLISHLPAYDKGFEAYLILKPKMMTAIAHGERLEIHQTSVSDQRIPNPSTQVHHLVKALHAMAEGK